MSARLVARILTLLMLAGGLALAGLVVALRLEHGRTTTLPAPTGPYGVGRALYDWRDSAADALAPTPGARRELLVWLWYPANAAAPAGGADYLPTSVRAPILRSRATVMGGFFTRDLARVRAHALDGAPLSSRRRSYPVLLLRGGASAEVWNYSTLAEDLASHGYVVVGFDAPWRTGVVAFPDGRVARRLPRNNPELVFGAPDSAARIDGLLRAWTGDMGFVLDRLRRLNSGQPSGPLAGRLDLARVGVFGHSLGGAEALWFCAEDARCRAGVDVDGAPLGSMVGQSMGQPFMFLLSGHDTSDAGSRGIMAAIRSIYDRLPAHGRALVELRGANHFLFSDDGALLKSHIVLGALRGMGVVGLEGRRQLALTSYCLRSFFDAYLGGGPVPPRMASPRFPEIRVLP